MKVGKIDIPSMVFRGQLETHRHVWNNIKRVQWSNSEGKSVAKRLYRAIEAEDWIASKRGMKTRGSCIALTRCTIEKKREGEKEKEKKKGKQVCTWQRAVSLLRWKKERKKEQWWRRREGGVIKISEIKKLLALVSRGRNGLEFWEETSSSFFGCGIVCGWIM